MNSDYTQQQSLGGLERAEALSLHAAHPPAQVEGYRFERLLGRGAYGQVWLGEDLNTRRKVAVKFYINRSGVNWQLINREVQHMVNMSTGRYIVQVLDVGWKAEPPFYVMEYLENGSLEDMLRAQGSLAIPAAARMFREIAEGLSFAHSKGVLHCDLKPANVVLDQDWRPRLADFGQSRMSDDQTPSLGTLFFMAPEQADLEAPPEAAWDVYALGAIAYCMLVGSPPYRTQDVVETLDTAESLPDRLHRYQQTIRKFPRPRLHYRRRGIDKGLCQIIDRCLHADPEKRYGNVQQVIGALDSRTRRRTRRPIYILGILGPLLLLPLMLLFSAKSIGLAKDETIHELRQQSIRSNRDTCRYAAKTLESEIASLFNLVEDEAGEPKLREMLLQVQEAARDDLQLLAQRKRDTDIRKRILRLPEQLELSKYLENRIQSRIGNQQGNNAIFNTVFVNDALGNNVGIYFADPADEGATTPVGNNYAYRSYFTGERADGDPKLPREKFRPLQSTSLSAHFKSTSTNKWKVGISSPIWPDEASEQQKPIGVLVLTINLGAFQLLSGDDGEQSERFAALVDGRPGKDRGVLIQHPFLEEVESSSGNSVNFVPQIEQKFLTALTRERGITNYIDPSSKFEGGDKYTGEWIAALQPVNLPNRVGDGSERTASDLWVLVQEKSSTVSKPVEQLGSKLLAETYVEFAALLGVMLVLWFFVFRLGRSSLDRGHGGQANLPSASYSTIDNNAT